MSKFTVVLEHGYVKVKRDGITICGAIAGADGHLRDIEFTDERHRRSNKTRQAAMGAYQQAGYR